MPEILPPLALSLYEFSAYRRMDLPQAGTSLMVLLISFAIYIFYFCYLHPLAKVPGPFLAKLTNLWRYYYFLQGDLDAVLTETLKRHNSSTLRIGPNSIVFSDTDSYKTIHGHEATLERGEFYRMFRFADQGESSVFSAKENSLHREKRKKLIGAAFTPSAVSTYENTIAKNADLWLHEIEQSVDKHGSSLDVAYLNKALALDTIYEVLTGESPKFQSMWTSQRFQAAIKHKEWTSKHGFGWGYFPVIAMFLELIGFVTKRQFYKRKVDRSGEPILRNFLFWQHLARCEDTLLPAAKLSQHGESKTTAMHRMVSLPETDSRKMKRDGEIMNEIRTLVFAGPPTLSAGLTSILYDLAKHVDWQEKLREEATTILSDQSLASRQTSPLLSAFIKESLRLRPMGPLGFPLEVKARNGVILPGNDLILPQGTEVGLLLCAVSRLETVWGPDAHDFDPQRWLKADEKQLRNMMEAWAAFGRGARACPGRGISLNLIQKCMTGIISRYRIFAEDEVLEGRCNFEMAYSNCKLTFKPL